VRIAVIGAGIAGLGAARALAGRADVELFEASPRPGGHALTVDLDGTAVDLGFLVYTEARYPRFTRLLAELEVQTQPTDMSFSSACQRCGLEFGTTSLSAMFAQRRRLLSPRHVRLLAGILEFQRAGQRSLGAPGTLGELLRREHILPDVAQHFVLPLAASLWSAAPALAERFAAAPVLRFFADHGMLAAIGAPTWRTITGGSRRYVDALVARLPARLHLATPVRAVRRDAAGALVATAAGERRFDAVVLAVHADQALALLADAGEAERCALAAFRFTDNQVVLHEDASFLPRARAARASWNHRLVDCSSPASAVEVTYDVGRLMRLGRRALVTLNPTRPPAGERARVRMAHPWLDLTAVRAQAAVESLQGTRATWYCGAWLGAGFHEDALATAERVARALLAGERRAA
jgi:predicted NAD/FAD-binding protein